MSDSDNWGWVNEIPPAWNPPAEIMTPTKNPGDNLAVLMLSSEIIGNDIVELVGEYLVEESRLIMWMYQRVPPVTLRDQALISQLINSVIASVYARWQDFRDVFRASGGLVGTYEKEREALSVALREGNRTLRDARGA